MTTIYHCYMVPDEEARLADLNPGYYPREAHVGTIEVPCDGDGCPLRSDAWIIKAAAKAFGRGVYATPVRLGRGCSVS